MNDDTPKILDLNVFQDSRGSLMPVLEQKFTGDVCIKLSRSQRGVIRGFHWQKSPYPQKKYIYVLEGEIFDVCMKVHDCKQTSTFVLNNLSETEKKLLYIPENYAHAFQCVSKTCSVMYICDGKYNEDNEMSFQPEKTFSGWPINQKIISSKDMKGV